MLNYFKHKSEVSLYNNMQNENDPGNINIQIRFTLAGQSNSHSCLYGAYHMVSVHFHPILFSGNTHTHTGEERETTVHYSALLSHSKKLGVKQATCEKCILVGELL